MAWGYYDILYFPRKTAQKWKIVPALFDNIIFIRNYNSLLP
jgi:hypothetical protein